MLTMSSCPDTPSVSIVMAAYNAAATIERSIASIQQQDFTHWQLFVVDDGSADDTAARVQAMANADPRIHVIQQANGGTAAARNNGLAQCNTPWIAFLDADDRWLPTYLTTALDTLSDQTDLVGLTYSWYYAVDEADHLVTLSPAYTVTGVAFHDVLQRESLLLPSTTVMHADILKAVPGFLTEHIHEDREFYLRVCKTYPIYPMRARLVLYQQSAQGKCRALLQQFDKAVQAEMSIVQSVEHLLTPTEVSDLQHTQKKNLFYRFLMYNYMQEARQLWGNTPLTPLLRDKKGLLAFLSVTTGINFLNMARCVIQGGVFRLIHPFWKRTLAQWKHPS
jgi:hypothetical protein